MTIAESQIEALDERPQIHFDAILHPYRSMDRNGFLVVVGAVGLVMLLVSIYFFFLGAWPIIGFAGLDVALLYWAFKRNFADARALERIHITDREVVVHRTCAKGRNERFAFNPYWVRMETEHEEDKGMTRLSLSSHGQNVEIGRFLHACERESLADALKSALFDAKTSPQQVSGG